MSWESRHLTLEIFPTSCRGVNVLTSMLPLCLPRWANQNCNFSGFHRCNVSSKKRWNPTQGTHGKIRRKTQLLEVHRWCSGTMSCTKFRLVLWWVYQFWQIEDKCPGQIRPDRKKVARNSCHPLWQKKFDKFFCFFCVRIWQSRRQPPAAIWKAGLLNAEDLRQRDALDLVSGDVTAVSSHLKWGRSWGGANPSFDPTRCEVVKRVSAVSSSEEIANALGVIDLLHIEVTTSCWSPKQPKRPKNQWTKTTGNVWRLHHATSSEGVLGDYVTG